MITDNIKSTIRGINKASDITTSTMGGSGKNVILSNLKDLVFTKDGVSVAEKIRFDDVEENIGARLLINAANKTVSQCGDGTTTTSLFIKHIVNNMFRDIEEVEDIGNYIEQRKEELQTVINDIYAKAIKMESIDDILHVAYTSSKSMVIANLIKDIYTKTGFKANITVEKSQYSNST